MRAADVVTLGETTLRTSRLGLGTAPLGGLYHRVLEQDAQATIEHAFDLDISFFDTAPLYGYGLSETRLGSVLSSVPRERFVVATKVGRLLQPESSLETKDDMWEGVPPLRAVFDFSADGTLRSLEESLVRLNLDRVDLVHIHDPDDHYDDVIAGALPALIRLREEGVIAAIGVGMNRTELLLRFAREASVDCFLVAGRYTLLDQDGLSQLLPLCLERRIAVVAGGVFNSGILADPITTPWFDYRAADPDLVQKALAIKAVCERHGVPLRAAALQFPLGHPAVVSVLTGCRTPAEIQDNVAMFDSEIPLELWDELRAARLLRDDVPTPTHTLNTQS